MVMPNKTRVPALTSLLALTIFLAAGCAGKSPAPGPVTDKAGPVSVTLPPGATARAPGIPSVAAARPGVAVARPLLVLEVYQMTLPVGGVSRNADFWKHVDEQRVDPATYDLLLKNGVRVGVAPDDDWDYFKDILDRNHTQSRKGEATAAGSGTIELTMKPKVPTEDIFYLTDKGDVIGRTYPQSENLLGVAFAAEPRHPGEVLISVSPVVRSLRSYLQFSVLNEERVIQEVRPEYLYDLNLRTVVAPNHFLVIAPSAESKFPTSLGSTFFRVDGVGQQYEQVLVLVPRASTRVEPTAAAR